MKKPEKNPESPVTTRVMEFVPPTDISSESPKSLSPQLCHKVIKRKLAPPEPGNFRSSPKVSFVENIFFKNNFKLNIVQDLHATYLRI